MINDISLTDEIITEEEMLKRVNEYLKAEQKHVKDTGKESMQRDLVKSYNKALNHEQ